MLLLRIVSHLKCAFLKRHSSTCPPLKTWHIFCCPTSASASCLGGFFANRTCFTVPFGLLADTKGWEVVPSQTLLVALFHNSTIPYIVVSPFIVPVALPLSDSCAEQITWLKTSSLALMYVSLYSAHLFSFLCSGVFIHVNI